LDKWGGVTVVLRKVRSKELDHLYSSPNTVLMTKQGRVRWLGMDNAGKGKAVPLQARRGPQGSRKLKFPFFVTTAQDGGRLSALCNGRLYHQEMLLLLTSVGG